MPRSLVAFCLCVLTLLTSLPSHAYTLRYNNTASATLRWNVQTIPIAISTSLSSPPGNVVAGSDAAGAVRRALASWEAAANIRFSITVSDRTDAVQDGINLITIADTSVNRSAFGSDSAALGLARNTFDSNGIISESDIVINHNSIPGLNRQYQFSTDGVSGYDLESTFAHEIGHLLGLGHSAVIGATMNANQAVNSTYNAPGTTARILAEDDRAGVRAIYGAPQATATLSGTVTSAGAPAFGIHVWAEEMASGRIAAGNVTLRDGSYRIGGLLPGSYRIVLKGLDADGGFITTSGIASGNSAYTGVGSASARSYEMADPITLSAGANAVLPISLENVNGISFNPRILGVRENNLIYTSTLAIPVTAGATRTIYIFGAGMRNLPANGVSVNSPHVTIVPNTFVAGTDSTLGEGIRFDITARPDAPGGEYSIRLQSSTGEVAYVPGALTIESNATDTNPAPIQVELRSWTVPQGGSVRAGAEVYVRLTLPDDSYRVTNWGTITQTATQFTVDATIVRGAVAAAVPSTIAQLYNLGQLTPGNYTFTFRSNLTAPQSVGFTAAVSTDPNPIDEASRFVTQHYRDFLARDPDAPGLEFWTSEITRCGADAGCIDGQRVGVSGSFFLSQEFQATGYFVYRFYKGGLGRAPYYAEFQPAVRAVAAGIVVDNRLSPERIDLNKRAFALAFVGREDFRRAYPANMTGAAFVDGLIGRTGIQPSAAERGALIADYDAGAGTPDERRARVLYAVVDGTRSVRSETNPVDVVQLFETNYGRAFYNREYNPAFVLMQYFGYLQRDPDAEGYGFWLDKLTRFGNFRDAEMVRAFIIAPEYRARFGQP